MPTRPSHTPQRIAVVAPIRWVPCVVALVCIAGMPAAAQTAGSLAAVPALQSEPGDGATIGERDAHALAARFAPILVFHGSEEYLPVDPLDALTDVPGLDLRPGRRAAVLEALGASDGRRAAYVALSAREKARRATVFYRAYHARPDGEPAVVLEYWLYYVHNTYRVRGNVLPFWIDGSHPNDLEHVHLVLRPGTDGTPALHDVYSSAHHGTMPANRHHFDAPHPQRLRMLVELGSHAMAADVDGDGRFTPGADGGSGYKMLWGIRDRGITWARYQSGYMDTRSDANGIVLHPPGSADDGSTFAYRLMPVETLAAAFDALALTPAERRAAFEIRRHPVRRLFGGDNGSSARLLVPPPRSSDPDSIGIDRFAATDRGIFVGTQLNLERQGLLAGVRYDYLLGGAYVPDLLLEADAVFTGRTAYLSTQFLVTYPIDGATTVMAGRALVSDSMQLAQRQWDWLAALEFPLGRMRIRVSSRSWGPITRYTKDVRISYRF